MTRAAARADGRSTAGPAVVRAMRPAADRCGSPPPGASASTTLRSPAQREDDRRRGGLADAAFSRTLDEERDRISHADYAGLNHRRIESAQTPARRRRGAGLYLRAVNRFLDTRPLNA